MDKKFIIFAVFFLGFLFPVSAHAQECYSRITKTDTFTNSSGTFPQVTIELLNAGVENANMLQVGSIQYATENLICPLGFTANSQNTHSVTCSLSQRHLELNELNKMTVAYSGAGAVYGELLTDYKPPTITGMTNYNNWTDPGNAYVSDNSYTTITVPYPNPQYTGQAYDGFGSFNIPIGAAITSVSVEIKAYTSNSSPGRQLVINLSRDGNTWQSNAVNNDLMWINPNEYIAAVHTYTTDLSSVGFTGYGWTPDDFNSGDFLVDIFANDNQSTTFSVDYIKVKVGYKQLDLSCFTASIGGVSCQSNIGTLCPNPQTGGADVPQTCNSGDILCSFKQWAYGTFMYWFGFNEDFSHDQFSALYTYLNYKFPFGYLAPLAASGFGQPIGSPSATLSDFHIGFTPKQVHGGTTTNLSPVALDVTGDTFAPVQPFLGYLRGFFAVIILFSTGVFIIANAGRFFS
jgi:hypothetical protein